MDESMEREFSDEELVRLLLTSVFWESHGSNSKAVWLLYTSGGSGFFRSNVIAQGLASSNFEGDFARFSDIFF